MASKTKKRREQGHEFEVVDLFAGPGGLGEGFTSLKGKSGRTPFKIALSVEKDRVAHQTLQLRAFFRQFGNSNKAPDDYWAHLRGEVGRDALFASHPEEAAAAIREAQCFELGPDNHSKLSQILKGLSLVADKTVVIGGPPCQAYSVAGRSRNGAKIGWSLETDSRSTLYREYLQVLAELQPAAFVMENVRGLLSAVRNEESVFKQIITDLENPRAAIKEFAGRQKKYRLVALSPRSNELALGQDIFHPTDFLVQAEKFGVPQARERVIVVGLRTDLFPDSTNDPKLPNPTPALTVRSAIGNLPRLRAGVSRSADDRGAVLTAMKKAMTQPWFAELPVPVRKS